MAGSATLGTNLVDRLAPLTDRLRRLEDRFGLRQFDVFRVHRFWSGARRGEGDCRVLLDQKLDPRPKVDPSTSYQVEPGGREDVGTLSLRAISLTYTEADLIGPQPLPPNEEWFFRVVDARGQAQDATFWVASGRAKVDREREMGWSLTLTRSRFSDDP